MSKKSISINIHARQDSLLDQILFLVDTITFEKLQTLFDKPLPTTDKLSRLLKTKAPWDKNI